MRGDRDEKKNLGHIALADFSLERCRGVLYVREMPKTGYFSLKLDVWFWKERYYLYQVVFSGNKATSGQLGKENVSLAQLLLLQFPANLPAELRASCPARVQWGKAQDYPLRQQHWPPSSGPSWHIWWTLRDICRAKRSKRMGVSRVSLWILTETKI